MMRNWWGKIRLIVMLSPQKLALLVFITVSVLSLLFQVMTFVLSPEVSPSMQCEKEKAAINEQIAASRACEKDSDCIAFKANCPFNCNTIHKDHTVALSKHITLYNQQCGLCISECTTTTPPSCLNHQCTF